MLLRTRHLLTNYIKKLSCCKRNYNHIINTEKPNNYIDYDKYVSTVEDINKEIKDIHMYSKQLNDINTEQKQELIRIQNDLSELNQTIKDQKYWLFHSVALSYIGLFTYIFNM